MKKIFLLTALCALVIEGNAYTYNYLAAPTDMKVTQSGNQFTLSWTQICKNTAMYESAPSGGLYTTTVKLVLHADDSKLEGTYTNSGSKSIDMSGSQLVYKNGSTTTNRELIPSSEPTFTITKVDEQYYSIGVGRLCFQNVGSTTNTYNYDYCYDENEILKKGISPTPFVFGLTEDAVGDYFLCAITELTVDTLASSTKNQYTLNFTQKCKYAKEYHYPNKTYTRTVKLVLNSDDRTLDGVYSTAGASATSSSANTNDQTINLVTSEISYDGNNYVLRSDVVSTFTIIKIDENTYGISEGELYFTQRVNKTSTWLYKYCYAEEDLPNKDATPKPYEFGWKAGYEQQEYNYDMTVNGISVMRDDSDYGEKRYFLTLNCVGVKREDNSSRNYEVQLAIYPSEASIVGTFSTRVGALLWASNSYVKDLKINKTRYLANDSISSIQIKSKGEKQYSFYGGTLICTDVDYVYANAHPKEPKRIEAVHYYHFSDNDGEGIEFGYDESNKTIELTINKVDAEATINGIDMEISAKDPNNSSYTVYIVLDSSTIDGTFTTANGLSLWSKVSKGSIDAEVQSGSTITINAKSGNTHTISGSMLCDNEYTYILKAFDFQYGEATGLDNGHWTLDNGQSRKILRDGEMIILRGGVEYSILGIDRK